jgi:hypothetical protein
MTAPNPRQWQMRGLATVGATLLATAVSAQSIETAQPRFPRWDASASIAMHQVRVNEVDRSDDLDYWEAQVEVRAQAGRYLTRRLKVELGVLAPMSYEFYESAYVPAPGLTLCCGTPAGLGFAGIDQHVRVLSFTPAVTWQFFDNTFVHPYVTVGVDAGVSRIHRFRAAGTSSMTSSGRTIRYDVPGVDTRETVTQARPFLAFGTKSYFNERWFARPEVQMGIARARIGQVSLRLGIGVDF